MHKRFFCFSLVTAVVIFLGFFAGPAFSGSEDFFEERLKTIQDPVLEKTLRKSIEAGLIENLADFDRALEFASRAAISDQFAKSELEGKDVDSDRNYTRIKEEIAEITSDFAELDRDALKVYKTSSFKHFFNTDYLFSEIKEEIPESYTEAYNLALLFNPKHGTNDASRLDKEIDKFLSVIENDPLIVKALKETNTTIKDLKKNWFGAGLGFEHIIAGEIRGTKVSGYHWWYKFYCDERKGFASAIESIYDIGNPYAFTGKFHWDPDGEGPLPNCYKSLGGFALGNSAQAILALGHVAVEVARKYGHVPQSLRFNADINGDEFSWQLYTVNGTIRTLYPLGNKTIIINPEDDLD
jgi:hypothetical protein